MLPHILAFLFYIHPDCLVPKWKVEQIVSITLQLEEKYSFPSGLMAAVVLNESGGRKVIRHHKGGCDVGEAQIFVPHCKQKQVKNFLDLRMNLEESAKILDRSRRLCIKYKNKKCPWGFYNAKSGVWVKNVNRLHSSLLLFNLVSYDSSFP